VEEVDEDHVVTEGFGGVTTIRTCKRCNSALGGGLEGRLLGPESLLTPLSQAHGWTKGSLRGVSEHGVDVQTHLGTGQHLLRSPRAEVLDENEQRLQLAVTWPLQLGDSQREGYLNAMARRHGGEVESAQAAPPQAATIKLRLRVEDLRRVVAKIALSTGAWKWGDEFTLSPLADWLRIVLDVWSDWRSPHTRPPRLEPFATGKGPLTQRELQTFLDQFKARIEPILERFAQHLPVGSIETPPPLTVMVPVAGGRGTGIAVRVLGIRLPVLAAPFPIVPAQETAGPVEILHKQRTFGGSQSTTK
jgi:hypothetical protein